MTTEALSYEEMAALVIELNSVLKGLTLERVALSDPNTFLLAFARNQRLLICCRPPFLRFHLTRSRRIGVETSSLTKAIEERLRGEQLREVSLVNEDRILKLHFARADLIAELIPRRPNLLLVDPTGVIFASLTGLSGEPYCAPPESKHVARAPSQVTSVAVEQHYDQATESEALHKAQRQAMTIIGRARETLRRRVANLQAQLDKAQRWNEALHEAELLKANFPALSKGMDFIVVADWAADLSPRTLTLRPDLAPAEQVALRFKFAGRQKRAIPHLERQIALKQEELKVLNAQLKCVQEAQSIEEIPPNLRTKERGVPLKREAQPFRRFVASDGTPILVGRNARENDQLSFQVAHGNDLWLHAHDYPGAHVLVQLARGQEITSQTLEEALQVAAHFSKAADQAIVDVCVTQAKHLRRPKGGPLGQVWLSEHRVLSVRPDPQRVREIQSQSRQAYSS